MAYLVQENTMIELANAIRDKNGSTAKMTPAAMITAINELEIGGGAAEPETCTVTITAKTFTGHIIYQTTTGWQAKYGSAFSTYTVLKNSAIFIVVDKNLYSLSGVIVSGNATNESAILSDSNQTCTYVIINGDATLTIRGSW